MTTAKIHIAIFASGAGSNARQLISYFKGHAAIHIALIVTNRADAGVLQVATDAGISARVITRDELNDPGELGATLTEHAIDGIVLAGFLMLIPVWLVQRFPDRIVNIHPALLPKYGGKGMYGKYVHQAVKDSGDTESGITIHYVNEHYDEGNIIFQARCALSPADTPETIATKVQTLEHEHFPKVVERVFG